MIAHRRGKLKGLRSFVYSKLQTSLSCLRAARRPGFFVFLAGCSGTAASGQTWWRRPVAVSLRGKIIPVTK
jgi:hypothetical protein